MCRWMAWRSLYASADVDALHRLYPGEKMWFATATSEGRLIASEPFSDLPGVWDEIDESSAVIAQRRRARTRAVPPSGFASHRVVGIDTAAVDHVHAQEEDRERDSRRAIREARCCIRMTASALDATPMSARHATWHVSHCRATRRRRCPSWACRHIRLAAAARADHGEPSPWRARPLSRRYTR